MLNLLWKSLPSYEPHMPINRLRSLFLYVIQMQQKIHMNRNVQNLIKSGQSLHLQIPPVIITTIITTI